ncbi:MAG: Alpha,alpha-trehalose-phosphate synthase/trehalose-phosphatase, partial [Parcubacteria group bacterium GW2011_GWC2_39_11]
NFIIREFSNALNCTLDEAKSLVSLYNIADVILVTPLRDGMNLIAKEYIASRNDGTGVLILSEMAGAAKELVEAILINPNDISEIASSIKESLETPIEDQIRRNRVLQERLKRYDILRWGDEVIKELFSIKEEQKKLSIKLLNHSIQERLLNEYKKANQRLILLDYDGTLMPFSTHPTKVKPDTELVNLLKELTEDIKNEVVILSGRDKETLQNWFLPLNLSLVAEHGIWIKEKGKEDFEMIRSLESEWKSQILPILKDYSDRLPGSFVEEKDFSLVFHYRQSDPEHASIILKDAIEYLMSFTTNFDVQILQGNKIVEVRCAGVNKGTAGLHWLSENYDFILAIGDDMTDEDLFKVLPEKAFSIKGGVMFKNGDEIIIKNGAIHSATLKIAVIITSINPWKSSTFKGFGIIIVWLGAVAAKTAKGEKTTINNGTIAIFFRDFFIKISKCKY